MKKATPAKKPVAAKTKAGASKTGVPSSGTKSTKTPAATKKAPEKKDTPPPAVTPVTKNIDEKPKDEKPKLEPKKIAIAEIGDFVKDGDKTIRNSPRWPLIIDEKEIAARFLQYQNLNLIQGFRAENMEPESMRRALLGAIRYGKPLVFDMMNVDLYDIFQRRFDGVMPGLFEMVMDKSILKEENYSKLIRESDGDDYELNKFNDFFMDHFMFLVITNNPNPRTEFLDRTLPVIII